MGFLVGSYLSHRGDGLAVIQDSTRYANATLEDCPNPTYIHRASVIAQPMRFRSVAMRWGGRRTFICAT
eukprot:838948-Alexandrium_andersonii.AAC.1